MHGVFVRLNFLDIALTVEFNPAAYTMDDGEMVELTAQLNRAADREATVVFTTVDRTAG